MLNGLGMEWGTIHHHLRILERAGLIRSVFEGRTHRYFPATTKSHEMHSLALLRRARVLTLVRRVVAVPGERQQELLTVIGLSRKVFRSYADRLVALGLLREVRAGRERRYFPTRALERLVNPDQHEPPAADPSSQ